VIFVTSIREIDMLQKQELFRLLRVKKAAEKAGLNIAELNNTILEVETPMSKDDIATVYKQIELLQ
jgi:hypothetical protein